MAQLRLVDLISFFNELFPTNLPMSKEISQGSASE